MPRASSKLMPDAASTKMFSALGAACSAPRFIRSTRSSSNPLAPTLRSGWAMRSKDPGNGMRMAGSRKKPSGFPTWPITRREATFIASFRPAPIWPWLSEAPAGTGPVVAVAADGDPPILRLR